MKKIVRYLSYVFSVFMISFSCLYAKPSPLDEVLWEVYGCVSSNFSVQPKPLFNEEVMPEVVRPFAEDFAAIKQRYCYGAAMSKKIDSELVKTICKIHEAVREKIVSDYPEVDMKWLVQYETDILNERFEGALNVVFVYYTISSIGEIDEYKAAIEKRLYELEADAKKVPQDERAASRDRLYKNARRERCYPTSVHRFLAFLENPLSE